MRQTVRVLTARVSIGLRPDRVTEHQARLLPLCVCKQSSGPLTSPTINNTFLLRPIRPLLFPTTPATHRDGLEKTEASVEVGRISQRHPPRLSWPWVICSIQRGWPGTQKLKWHTGSLYTSSQKERIIHRRLESNTTRKRLADFRDSQATMDLLEAEKKLESVREERQKKRQASSNDHVLTTCT